MKAGYIAVPLAAAALGILAWILANDGSAGGAASCYPGPLGEVAAIEGGRYAMGSEHHYPDEGPVVEVAVDGFEIDRHEVTNAQFRRFVQTTGHVTSAERAVELGFGENGSAVFADGKWAFVPGADWRHPDGPGSSIEGRDRDPVVQVSYEDALAYAEWAGRALPTEAQWEYAARGGLDGAEFAWGEELVPHGEHLANTWQGPFPLADAADDGYAGRAPVGCFPANGYGLYDMIGNVWEWTADPYHTTHRHAADPNHATHRHGTDPYHTTQHAGTAAAGDHGFDPRQPGVPVGVIKGGSFLCSKTFCRRYRPAARFPQDKQLGTNHLGFRTVTR